MQQSRLHHEEEAPDESPRFREFAIYQSYHAPRVLKNRSKSWVIRLGDRDHIYLEW